MNVLHYCNHGEILFIYLKCSMFLPVQDYLFNDRVVLISQICYQFLSCSPVRPPSHKDSLSAAHVQAAFQSRGFGREQATCTELTSCAGLEASAVHNQAAVGF